MPSRRVEARITLASLLLLLTACGGGSTGPSTGTLVLDVSGLPTSVEADITVSGPNGFTRHLMASETLADLPSGRYTVSAVGVSAGSAHYVALPASQAVQLDGGIASAEVAYLVASGSLALTIAGLPAGSDAAVTVSGPNGFNHPVTATETMTGLTPGQYTVTALAVSDGSEQYSPAPSSQTVAVGSGTAMATVNYSTGGAAGFNLRVDGVYLVQSVQTYARGVPLVKDRDALLRVFVTANQVNTAAPLVRVTFFHSGLPVSVDTIQAPGLTTPLGPDEHSLAGSWNLDVDRTLVQPDLAIVIEVDPGNAIAEGNEADNLFPASGTPLAMDVRTTDPFSVRFVPVITKANNRQGNVTAANHQSFLDATMRMHPLAGFAADVRVPYTTTTSDPLQSNNANGAWGTILQEIFALRAVGESRYYYGVVNPSYHSGVAGMGYIGGGAAVGWDKLPSASSVAAHEWGHNWGRNHAPCGSPGNPDDGYPYAGGEIGVVGYDLVAGDLKPADSHDLMGYCNNEWISDYTYNAVMTYRSSESAFVGGMGQAIQPGLLVWGRVVDGRAVLEPAFQVTARPSLPRHSGPYRLEARAADGERIFFLDFAPLEVADDPTGSKHFTFVVPLRPERAGRIASLRLEGQGLRASMTQASTEPVNVEVTRGPAGRVALRWDARKAPMIMVRDPVTGDVLSFARGGSAEVVTTRDDLLLGISDQVRSRDLRVRAVSR